MNIPDLSHIGRGMRWSANWIKNNFPDFYNKLMEYPNELTFAERIWWYKNNLSSYPLCECGKRTKFINANEGYRIYCSKKCLQNSPTIKQKTAESKSKLNKDEIKEKQRKTNLERYGVEYTTQSKIVREKRRKTNLERYGVENPFSSDEIKNKIRKTTKERYGVDWIMQSKEYNNKMHSTMLEKYGVKHALQKYSNIIKFDETNDIHTRPCPHPKCDKCADKCFEIHDSIYNDRKQNGAELCTKLKPEYDFSKSSMEDWVECILLKNNITYETHCRISNREMDFYIPEKNLAIECNGCYWHSDLKKDKLYHNDKYKLFKSNGIILLSVWEDWIKTKPTIIESIILSKLGIYQERIYARKCNIKEIDFKTSSEFIKNSHIQGCCSGANINIGLFFNDELVSVMTFGNSRYENNSVELLRYCCKCGVQVIGGASKMFNYFVKQYKPNKIISYASNDISDGKLYEKLGFEKIAETNFSYWYIDKRTFLRYNRQKFTKHQLKKILNNFDENKTEFEMMNETKQFFRIFDTGQKKYEKKFNTN